jgi:hypothetical protein
MRTRRLVCAVVATAALPLASATAASAQPPNPDNASCVEQFNLAVGTPGEFERVAHQVALGRDVSFFARIPKEACPF